MREAEWITTRLPLYMLREYPRAWDERKARLFWVACVLRRISGRPATDRLRQLVERVEADPADAGGSLDAEVQALRDHFVRMPEGSRLRFHRDYWKVEPLRFPPPESLLQLVRSLYEIEANVAFRIHETDPDAAFRAQQDAEAEEKARLCDLIREVFGNPFRPVDFAPWRTSDAVALARGIYDEKAFDRMPILADALQDAGCDDVNVLDHCRDSSLLGEPPAGSPNPTPATHVRGCWVLDGVLGQ